MREILARALSGPVSLMEVEHREGNVDRLHAIASAQLRRVDEPTGPLERYNLSHIGRCVTAYVALPVGDPGADSAMIKARDSIAQALLCRGFRLELQPGTAALVAFHALREHKDSTCRVCNGRTDALGNFSIPDVDRIKGWREGDGPVPMKVCPACGGTGKHRFGDDERANSIGEWHKNMNKAFSVAHSLISQAIYTLDRRTAELSRDRSI